MNNTEIIILLEILIFSNTKLIIWKNTALLNTYRGESIIISILSAAHLLILSCYSSMTERCGVAPTEELSSDKGFQQREQRSDGSSYK